MGAFVYATRQWRLAAVLAVPVWYHIIFKVGTVLLALLSFFNHKKLNQPWKKTEGRAAEHTIANISPSLILILVECGALNKSFMFTAGPRPHSSSTAESSPIVICGLS